MKVVKILLLLLSLLVYLGFFFYQNKRLPNLNDFKSSSSPQKVLGAFTFEDSSKIAKEQMGILSQKSTKVKKQIDEIKKLNRFIGISDDGQKYTVVTFGDAFNGKIVDAWLIDQNKKREHTFKKASGFWRKNHFFLPKFVPLFFPPICAAFFLKPLIMLSSRNESWRKNVRASCT